MTDPQLLLNLRAYIAELEKEIDHIKKQHRKIDLAHRKYVDGLKADIENQKKMIICQREVNQKLTAENAVLREEGTWIMNNPVYSSQLALTAWNKALSQPNPWAAAMLEVIKQSRECVKRYQVSSYPDSHGIEEIEKAIAKLDQVEK